LQLDEGAGAFVSGDIITITTPEKNNMAADTSSPVPIRSRSLAVAFLLFMVLVLIFALLEWMLTPLPLIFSEKFKDPGRNQQYLPCAAFTIVDERLRVTVAEPHSGCAVRLPDEYEDFTFIASVFPVGDVHDASVNILVRQGYGGWYEIQFRPKEQQVNFISFAVDTNGNPYYDTTTGWQPTTGTVLKNSGNQIRVKVTEQWMGFWFNDALLFTATSVAEFPFDRGAISIGVGAGETGSVAFEYDNLEIREEKFFSRWWYDFMVKNSDK
jgi:hypothetical protein